MRKRSWIVWLVILSVLATLSCNLIHRLPGRLNETSPTMEGKSITLEPQPSIEPAKPTAEEQQTIVPLSQGPLFALFEESPGETAALIKQEKIAPDLSNVRNSFLLSGEILIKSWKMVLLLQKGMSLNSLDCMRKLVMITSRYSSPAIRCFIHIISCSISRCA